MYISLLKFNRQWKVKTNLGFIRDKGSFKDDSEIRTSSLLSPFNFFPNKNRKKVSSSENNRLINYWKMELKTLLKILALKSALKITINKIPKNYCIKKPNWKSHFLLYFLSNHKNGHYHYRGWSHFLISKKTSGHKNPDFLSFLQETGFKCPD